jgi:hypothetical protein
MALFAHYAPEPLCAKTLAKADCDFLERRFE